MILSACSMQETVPIKSLVVCPQVTECKAMTNLRITKNQDLATALNQSLDRLDICVIAYRTLNECIQNHNNINFIHNKQ